MIIATVFYLYLLKPDSANGRVLIWTVSANMIKDKPILGFGSNGFDTKYMDYQAMYFKDNPESQYSMLADNPIHPMNEFLLIGINYGTIGILIVFILLILSFYLIYKYGGKLKSVILGSLVALVIWSFFSYPLRYPSVGLVAFFYIIYLLGQSPKIKISFKYSMLSRFVIILICLTILEFCYIYIDAELRWKRNTTVPIELMNENEQDNILNEYRELHKVLGSNQYFLYNYGATLNTIKLYTESHIIIAQCQKISNNYEIQLLQGDNSFNLGDIDQAIKYYTNISYMIPSRYMPLYKLFVLYDAIGQEQEALRIARMIVSKKMKVSSLPAFEIIRIAKQYIDSKNNFTHYQPLY